MQILNHYEHKRKRRVRTFKCSACGCKFKAGGEEYGGAYWSYYCICPNCGYLCFQTLRSRFPHWG